MTVEASTDTPTDRLIAAYSVMSRAVFTESVRFQ